MAATSPMETLLGLAEKSLDEATRRLGQSRQAWQDAVRQHNDLLDYEKEYRAKIQQTAMQEGIPVLHLLNHGAFMQSLETAVVKHESVVSACERNVDLALVSWRRDKKRHSAFSTLKERGDAVRRLRETRQDQKMMDEFAQRASLRDENR